MVALLFAAALMLIFTRWPDREEIGAELALGVLNTGAGDLYRAIPGPYVRTGAMAQRRSV